MHRRRHRGWSVPRAGRAPDAAHRGAQRRGPDRAQAGVDQDHAAHRARSSARITDLVKSEGLHTVCQEAGCPNIFECWEDREATFLIGGSQCTRRCDFCQIDTGKPDPLDRDEPRRVAESVQTMGLRYATVTGVARDDLPDEGVWLYAETVRAIHAPYPGTGVEAADPGLLRQARAAGRGLRRRARRCSRTTSRRCRGSSSGSAPAFRYDRSLDVITPGPRRRAGDQVQPDPGHGRDRSRRSPGAARPARRRLRADHHHPVPAPLPAAPPGGALGEARRSSSSWPRRPSGSASPA